MATDGSVTLTTASTTNIAQYEFVPLDSFDPSASSLQVARVFATAIGATGAGSSTLTFKLVDTTEGEVVFSANATLTVTTVQAGADGASGDYLCTVAFADGTDRLDLLGAGGKGNSMKWKVGLSGAFPGTTTAIRVDFAFTQAV